MPYVHRFDVRDGVRIGGGHRAELVNHDSAMPTAETGEQRRQTLLIDAAYREWARNRGDVDRLRQLHDAISERLDGLTATRQR